MGRRRSGPGSGAASLCSGPVRGNGQIRREEFAGPEAELNLQQLSWVGPRALRHEAVIEEVMASSPVLPARFGTLFSSAEAWPNSPAGIARRLRNFSIG